MTTKAARIIEDAWIPSIRDPEHGASDVTVKITPDGVHFLSGFGSAIRLTRGDLADVVKLLVELDGRSSPELDAFLAQEQQG